MLELVIAIFWVTLLQPGAAIYPCAQLQPWNPSFLSCPFASLPVSWIGSLFTDTNVLFFVVVKHRFPSRFLRKGERAIPMKKNFQVWKWLCLASTLMDNLAGYQILSRISLSFRILRHFFTTVFLLSGLLLIRKPSDSFYCQRDVFFPSLPHSSRNT